jgi:hypothetical protein
MASGMTPNTIGAQRCWHRHLIACLRGATQIRNGWSDTRKMPPARFLSINSFRTNKGPRPVLGPVSAKLHARYRTLSVGVSESELTGPILPPVEDSASGRPYSPRGPEAILSSPLRMTTSFIIQKPS